MIRKSLGAMFLAGALLATMVPGAFAKGSVVVPPSKATASIVDTAVAAGSFKTLVAAVGCADPAVLAALTSGEQLTVFAPTDQAFKDTLGVDETTVCSIPQGLLTSVLLYHVEGGRHFSNSVVPTKDGQMKTIDTLLGASFWVSKPGVIATTGGQTGIDIVAANIPATNGVIHVIDRVLLPIAL